MIGFFLSKVLSLGKKLIIVFATFFLVIFLFLKFTTPAQPAISTADIIQQNRAEIYKVINDKNLNSTKEGKTTIAIYRVVTCSLNGEGCTNNPKDGDKNFDDSLFGYVTKIVVLPFVNPPASGIQWAYTGLQKTGFVSKTYAAQGIGFAATKPLIPLWEIFRNVAYILLVLVLITIGFLIMFRVKINPQTVITLENSLPRIIASLLLITFSFAIAGFLIDLMYVFIGLAIAVISKNSIAPFNPIDKQAAIFSSGGFQLFNEVFVNGDYWGVGEALFQIIPGFLANSIRLILGAIAYFLILKIPVVGDFVSGKLIQNTAELGGLGKAALGGAVAIAVIPIIFLLSPFLLSILVFLSALFVFFRIFFLLLKSYLMILVLIIFSPIILLFEAIPGRNVFLFWIRSLTSNLIAFPIVVVLITVSSIIVAVPNATQSNFWSPPFLYGVSPHGFAVLVGVGILFLIPEIVKVIREFLGVKEAALRVGPGIFFAGLTGAGGAATESLSKYGSIAFAFGQLRMSAIGRAFGLKAPEGGQRGGGHPPPSTS